jgi:hypothetical protein
VVNAFCVFALVVLDNQALLAFFDVLPVGFETYIVHRIAIEHELGWCSLRGGVDCGTHGETDSR